MSPRHFAKQQNPNIRREEDNGFHNAFVAFTHLIGLKGFTYADSPRHYDPAEKRQGSNNLSDPNIQSHM